MSFKLRIALRVIKRRIAAGETLETVLADYPGLSEEDRNLIRQEVQGA